MRVTDRPGRYVALVVFAPLLIACGAQVYHPHRHTATLLTLLGVSLFAYELFWVSRTACEFTYL